MLGKYLLLLNYQQRFIKSLTNNLLLCGSVNNSLPTRTDAVIAFLFAFQPL
jgi:hypothetical protein